MLTTKLSAEISSTGRVGATELYVPSLGFGGASVGNLYRASSEESARIALQRSVDCGITYIDTAPHYGHGLSEVRIGGFLASLNGHRPTLSTKVGRLLVPAGPEGPIDQGFVDPLPFNHVFDYSYDGIMRSFDASCDRLGVDQVDILYMHDIGAATHGTAGHRSLFKQAMNEGFRAMSELKRDGRVQAIGLGVNEWEVCMESFGHADFDVFMLAGRYTLLEQTVLDTFFPECERRGVSIVNASPFNSGLLARRPDKSSHYNYCVAPIEIIVRATRFFDICASHGVNTQAAAIQFACAHPVVASVVSGMSSAERVTQAAEWFNEDIPSGLWQELASSGLMHSSARYPEGADL